jgi:ComF family protein
MSVAGTPSSLASAWLASTFAPMLHAGRATLDLLLPPQCLCCDAPVETHGQLCAACFGQVGFISEPQCSRCGVPFAATGQAGADGTCLVCAEAPPIFARARAPLRYDAYGRRLILPLKHADRPELAAVLAPHMARAGAALLRRADLLVPVPLHRRRLFTRRYNQAALLAFALSRITSVPALADVLVRRHATAPLGEKSAVERADAVRDAFTVRPGRAGRMTGRRVLLIDDVMTSGATANACAACLLAAGAAAVDVLLVARVPDPRLT